MPEYRPSAFKHRHHAEKSAGRVSKQDESQSLLKEDISKVVDLLESKELKSRMDLVTREEFDVQQKILQRTREKLEILEAKIAKMENISS